MSDGFISHSIHKQLLPSMNTERRKLLSSFRSDLTCFLFLLLRVKLSCIQIPSLNHKYKLEEKKETNLCNGLYSDGEAKIIRTSKVGAIYP